MYRSNRFGWIAPAALGLLLAGGCTAGESRKSQRGRRVFVTGAYKREGQRWYHVRLTLVNRVSPELFVVQAAELQSAGKPA